MGKSRKPLFNMDNAMKALGVPDISNSQVVKEADLSRKARNDANPLAPDILQPSHRSLKYDKEVYSELLEPGQWGLSQTGMNDALSENQYGITNILKGIVRGAPITYQKFLSQSASLAHTIDKTIGRSDDNAMTDERLSEYLQDVQSAETAIKDTMPIYENSNYQDKSLMEQLGTTQFWADTVVDGVAFVAAMAAGTKGLSGAANAIGGVFKYIPMSQRVVKLGNQVTTGAISMANAGMTASMQGEQAYREVVNTLQNTIDPETGVYYTADKAKAKGSEAAAKTFNSTFVTHMWPAVWETRTLMSLSSKLSGAVGTEARKRLVSGIQSGEISMSALYANPGKFLTKSALKVGAKEAGIGILTEGLYEENIENAIVSEAVNNTLTGADRGFGATVGEYANQMVVNLGDKEAVTEMFVGSLIGGAMGGVKGAREARHFNKQAANYVNGMQAADNLYLANISAPYMRHLEDSKAIEEGAAPHKKGDLILDKQGNPIVDKAALLALTRQSVADQSLADSSVNAFINNSPETIWMNENLSISSSIFTEMARAEAFGDTPEGALDFMSLRLEKRLDEIEAEQQAGVASPARAEEGDEAGAPTPEGAKRSALLAQRKNNIRQRVSEMGKEYKKANNQIDGRIGVNDSPEKAKFFEIAKKNLFYEAVKRITYDQLVADLTDDMMDPLADKEEIAKKIEGIGKSKEASFETSRNLLNNTDAAFNTWNEYENFLETTAEVQKELLSKKDRTPEENQKLHKANFEFGRELYAQGTFAGVNIPRVNIDPAIRQNESTGRRTEIYNAIGQQLKQETEFSKNLEAGDMDTALHTLSNMPEQTDGVETAIERQIDVAQGEVDQTSEDLDKAFADALDSVNEFDSSTYTPEINEAMQRADEAKDKLAKAELLKDEFANKKNPKFSEMTPDEVSAEMGREFTESLQKKAKHIEKIALLPNGEVKDDFLEVNAVVRAISDLETHLGWFEETYPGNKGAESIEVELKNVSAALLDNMRRIFEAASLNKANLLGRQKAISGGRADLLIEMIEDPAIMDIFKLIFGPTIHQRLDQIKALTENKLEAVNALITYAKEKGHGKELEKALTAINKDAKAKFLEVLKTQGVKEAHFGKQFAKNPAMSLLSAWVQLANKKTSQGVNSKKGSPYEKFENTKDYSELLVTAKEEDTNVAEEVLVELATLTKKAEASTRFKLQLLGNEDQAQELLAVEPEETLVPTPQQEIAVREAAGWINSKKADTPYSNWAYLRGVAGTGKTNIVLRWALKLAGIPSEDVIGTARIENAAQVLANATGSKAVVFSELDLDTIEDNVNLLVIDEYATINNNELRSLEERIRLLNQTREHKISVIILGDPTQITPNGALNNDLTVSRSRGDSHNIQHFSPLTVVYRSDVSAVNELSSFFQGNTEAVTDLSVRASSPITEPLSVGAHTTVSGKNFVETIKRNQEAEALTGAKPRSRAIIVGSEADVSKYEGIEGVEVMWVVDSQSKTYDEVYVDIDAKGYPTPTTLNTATYTAVSRAKQYVQLVSKGENNTDTSLIAEKDVNLGNIKESHTEFRNRKGAEVKFLEDLRNGKPLKNKTKKEEAEENKKAEAEVTTPTNTTEVELSREEAVETEDEPDEVTQEEEDIETTPTSEDPALPTEDGLKGEYTLDVNDIEPIGFTDRTGTDTTLGELVSELNVDKDLYSALSNGAFGDTANIIYVQNTSGNIDSYIEDSTGNWVRAGYYNTSEALPEVLADGLKLSTPARKGAIEEALRNKWSYQDFQNHPAVLAHGKVNAMDPMRFEYSAEPNEGKGADNLVDWLTSKFKGFFGESPYQKSREDKVTFKIFSRGELTKRGYINSQFAKNIKPGLPYMIIGGLPQDNGYEHAFFVPLQPKGLAEDSSQVTVLRRYRDAVAKFSAVSKIEIGSTAFGDVIKGLRSGLEIVNVEENGLTTQKVGVKESYTYEDFKKAVLARNTPNAKTVINDPLRKLKPAEADEAIRAGLEIALMSYGIKKVPTLFTEQEIINRNVNLPAGDEFIGVINKQGKDPDTGEDITTYFGYSKVDAVGKDKRSVYASSPSLDSSKGIAQIAFNQIARANEYVGGTRIRALQYSNSKSKRHISGTGKSLLTGKGGDTRISYLFNVLKSHHDELGISVPDRTSAQVVDAVRQSIKSKKGGKDATAEDVYASLKGMIAGIADTDVAEELTAKVEEAYRRKETPPVTLDTLNKIVDPSNFQGGRHMSSQPSTYVDSIGNQTVGPTYLRAPLNRETFNKLGREPQDNKEELDKILTSRLSAVKKTAVSSSVVKKGYTAPAPQPTAGTSQSAGDTKTNSLVTELDEVVRKLADPSLPIKEKMALMKRKIEITNELAGKAYDANVRGGSEGHQRISIRAAKELYRRLLPSASESELEFLSKAMLDKVANKNENLLGLYKAGRISIATDGNTVSDQVLRHEIFHKVFNEYLTESERRKVVKEFTKGTARSIQEVEEDLADAFMVYRNTKIAESGFLSTLFNKILKWFGLVDDNENLIDTVFDNILSGKYTDKVQASTVRRAYSDKKNYGNAANYQEARARVRGIVYRDVVKIDDLSVVPLTLREAYNHTKSTLQNSLSTNKREIANNELLIEELKSMTEGEPQDLADAAEMVKLLETNNSDMKEDSAILSMMFPTNETTGKLTSAVFKDLWKDIFPTYDFSGETDESGVVKSENSFFDKQEADFSNLSQEEIELIQLSGLQDFVLQSDTRNQEAKMSDKVKNFLSFIYNSKGDIVNHRQAYFAGLVSLTEVLPSETNLASQIKYNAEKAGIDLSTESNNAKVVHSILDLIHNATTEVMTTKINDTNVELDLAGKYMFTDEDTYRVVASNAVISRLKNQSNVSFLSTIVNAEIEADPTVDTEVLKRTINAAYRQTTAQETLRGLVSLFASQSRQTYMIGEKSFERDDAWNLIFKRVYFEAQSHGGERSTATDVTNTIIEKFPKIKLADWKKFDAQKDPKEKMKFFVNEILGVKTRSLNTFRAKEAMAALEGFRNVVNSQAGKMVIDPLTLLEVPAGVEYFLKEEKKLINLLTQAIVSDTVDSSPTTTRSAQGKTKYAYANGSQAREILNRMIRFALGDNFSALFEGKDKYERLNNSLPPHLRGTWGKNNIFVNGKNSLRAIRDHDGMRIKGREEFGIEYSGETDADFIERNLLFGFADYMKTHTSANETPKYTQFFYTISNRPRMVGVEVNVLDNKGIREGIKSMIKQTLDQPTIVGIAGYDPSKMVNASLVKSAIEETIKKPFDKQVLTELAQGEGFTEAQMSEIVDRTISKLRLEAEKLLKKVEYEGKGEMLASSTGIPLLKSRQSNTAVASEQNPDQYIDEQGRLVPLVERETFFKRDDFSAIFTFVANNYVNGYFMNQLPVGNFNFFKHAADLVKRMSGVFAPGSKGLVAQDGKIFMKPKFRTAVMSDPRLFADELSEIFKGTELEKLAQSKNKGTEFADGQGFMLPSRLIEIEKGFGKAYKAGNVVKPAYYGQIPVMDIEGDTVHVPFMVKYSSVVLSDELVAKFPKLAKLRDSMEAQKVEELIFDSAAKVVKPDIKDANGKDLRAMPSGLKEGEDFSFSIPSEAVYDLDNENYRLQLNPSSKAYGNISFMTQLAYFMNTGHRLLKNNPNLEGKYKELRSRNELAATSIYKAFAELVAIGNRTLAKDITKSGAITKDAILDTLTGEESYAIATIMREGGSYNLPQIVDKAMIQMMNRFAKKTIQPKFKGGHFVLQAPYGIEILGDKNTTYGETINSAHQKDLSPKGKRIAKELATRARKLKYKQDGNGRIVAEVIISREFADKVKAGEFLLPDAMGFRIPSTGLHSAVALEVVGYYDSKDSNIVIAPPELVLQHGSDFDVDSLYVLGREVINSDKYKDLGFPTGSVPGYDKNMKYAPIEFTAKLATIPDADPRKDRLNEMFQKNIITESFLGVISDPDNKDIIAEPISTVSIDDAFSELSIDEARSDIDLSLFSDNMEIYNSNFQGAKLVGTFANGAKSLAYMLNAGPKKGYPTVGKFEGEKGTGISLFGQEYKSFSETTGNYNIWQILDALINTSVDNVKDQKLFLMNATNFTGKHYIAGLSMGIPLPSLIEFMLQPISLELTAKKGKMNKLPEALLSAYNTAAKLENAAGGTIKLLETNDEFYQLLNEAGVSQEKAKTLRNKRLSDLTSTADIIIQGQMYKQLKELNDLADAVSSVSSAIGVLQNFPVTYTDILAMDEKWNSIFSIGTDGTILTDEDGSLVHNNTFPYDLSELFNSQPNIKSAYEAYVQARTVAFESFVKHTTALNDMAGIISSEENIRISWKNAEGDLKNELFSYLLASMYAEEIADQPSIQYATDKGASRILVGKAAWSHEFAKRVERVKKNNPDNRFLQSMSINKAWGVYSLAFAQDSSKDVLESFKLQEGFETLPNSSEGLFEDGELVQGLVKYAVLNFGMRFGNTNYSTYLSADSLKRLDDYINKDIRGFLKGVEKQSASGFLKVSPLSESFADQLAVAKPEALPKFQTRNNKPIQQGAIGEFKIYAGKQGDIWFNNKFIIGEGDIAPKYFANEQNKVGYKVYKRVYEAVEAEGKTAYYQELGLKNYAGGYNPISLEHLSAPQSDLFDGKVMPIPTTDVRQTTHEVRGFPVNLLKKGETVWLYPNSDVTRQTGIPAEVVRTSFNTEGRPHTVTVKHLSPDAVEFRRAEYRATTIIEEMKTRFKVPVKAVLAEGMPQGAENNKGAIRNGIIYLNFSLLKTDVDINETAFHEISHPIIAEIANRNPKWYQNLVVNMLEDPQGQIELAAIKEKYPELSEAEQVQEAVVTMAGKYAANERSFGKTLSQYLKKVVDNIGNFIREFLKGGKIKNLDDLSNAQLAAISLADLSYVISSRGKEFKLDLSESVKKDWDSRRMDEVEERLFKEGRLTFTCKA